MAEAVRQVDEHGWHELSMGDLAARLKIKTPSLYNHVDGVSGLRRMLALRAAAMLDDAMVRVTVGKSGDDAVRAMAQAHRAFLKAHPGLAEATVAAPPKRDRAWNEAADRVVKTCLLVLQGYGLDQRLGAARTARPAQRHPRLRNARTPRRIRTAARRRSQFRVADRLADRLVFARCVR